jgi:hypothetical protein
MGNTVKRKVIRDFVETLGLNPADVREMTIVDSKVIVTVFDKVGGHKVIDPATDEFRKSAVVLHMVD